VEETKTFYRALRQCGADFGMMQHFCEGRTRAQLKRNFQVESRRNPRLVDELLTFTSAKAAKKEEPLENDDDDDDDDVGEGDIAKKEGIVVEEEYDEHHDAALAALIFIGRPPLEMVRRTFQRDC
jgi:hypothetical protein